MTIRKSLPTTSKSMLIMGASAFIVVVAIIGVLSTGTSDDGAEAELGKPTTISEFDLAEGESVSGVLTSLTEEGMCFVEPNKEDGGTFFCVPAEDISNLGNFLESALESDSPVTQGDMIRLTRREDGYKMWRFPETTISIPDNMNA